MNLVLTVTQVLIGVRSKSQGLVADAIHSLSHLVATGPELPVAGDGFAAGSNS